MAPSSKDLARRLRFAAYPSPDPFRRRFGLTAIVAVLAGAGAWALLAYAFGERQYLPGPVSPSHARFGDRCASCHDSFHEVRDQACLTCHGDRTHSPDEKGTPACATCHVEHGTADASASASDRACIDCHNGVQTEGREPAIDTIVTSLVSHPPFTPLRAGQQAIRFSHKAHKGEAACKDCHFAASDGGLYRPIQFPLHCQGCHLEHITVKSGAGGIEALHAKPSQIRDDLQQRAGAAAVPGLEGQLYSGNDRCFYCHVRSEAGSSADGLPKLAPTSIPARWLMRGEFSHRRHDMMDCTECHGDVQASEEASAVLLPDLESCLACHVDGKRASAGTSCVLCHLYHDTSKAPVSEALGAPARARSRLVGMKCLQGGACVAPQAASTDGHVQ